MALAHGCQLPAGRRPQRWLAARPFGMTRRGGPIAPVLCQADHHRNHEHASARADNSQRQQERNQVADPMADDVNLPAALFERIDPSSDAFFYREPRLVKHIDDATIAALTNYYAEVLPKRGTLLDLMSSWVSHLPSSHADARVVGLGMNAAELAANPRLAERVVQDLNQTPLLPFETASLAAVMIVVSVQYLTQPVQVFGEIARVLEPAGRLVVAMSHRCFPTKAVRAFRELDPADRVRLVSAYCRLAGGFTAPVFVDRSPAGADPLWIVTAERADSIVSR